MTGSVHKYVKIAAFLLIAFLFSACASLHPRVGRYGIPDDQYSYHVPEKIDDGWETESLSRMNVSPEMINALMLDILNMNFRGLHSVLLVKNGNLIVEEYFYRNRRFTIHDIYSATKSITSILIGIAFDRRMISNLDHKVYKFFPDYKDLPWIDRQYDITLKDLLTMTGGLDWDERSIPFFDVRNNVIAMLQSENWIKYVLKRKGIEPPGERFNYNGGLTILLGEVLKKTTGFYSDKFAEKYLFGPLGIKDYSWEKHIDGTVNTQGGLSLRPRDMAKIGYLYLNGGKWRGKQIISPMWIHESTKAHVATNEGYGYGFQWWRGKAVVNNQVIETFFAWGRGGQYIFVFPDLDLVAVFTSEINDNLLAFQPFGMLINYIIPAVLPAASSAALPAASSATLPSATSRQFVKLKAGIVDAYIGKYKNNQNTLTIFREGDNLFGRIFEENIELSPQKKNKFVGTSKVFGDLQVRFIKNGEGEVTQGTVNIAFSIWFLDKIK